MKLAFDGTTEKHYSGPRNSISHDWAKLKAVRRQEPDESLFLVVFFVQLPNRVYPPNKKREVVHGGIDAQYRRVRELIGIRPAWPAAGAGGPVMRTIRIPDEALTAAIARRFAHVNALPDPSHFDVRAQLRGAAVGVCIWEYPAA